MAKVDYTDVKKRIIAGETYKSIGESYNVTKQAIAKIAKKAGVAGAGVIVRQNLRAKKAGFETYDDMMDEKAKKKLESFLQNHCK